MRVTRQDWSIAAGLLCCLASQRHASGQAVGYQLDRYEPTPAGDPFSIVELPWYSSTRWFAAGLTFDYAHNLLVAGHVDPGGNVIEDSAVIAHHQGGHLDLAGSLYDRVGLSLSVPMVLSQSGTAFAGIGPGGTTAGDPRIGVRARLFGETDSALSLSAVGYLWIPVGVEDQFAGDSGVRGMARLTAGGLWRENVRWASNASFLARKTASLSTSLSPAGNTVGNEVQLSAGLGYLGFDGRLSVGPEAIASFAVAGDVPDAQNVASFELFGTSRYQVTDQLMLGLGVGGSVAGEPGPPDFRVLFSIAYAPVRPRGSSFESVIVLPDEDGHVGGVEVSDGKQKTLLDKPYAASEISKKGGAKLRAVTSSPEATAKRIETVARVLPLRDRDGDGIVDGQDGCPERAGIASTDLIRNGCPVSAEKVIVLPDADGHVGAVEIDDGRTKTLVDKAYASAEVSTDGVVRAVPPAPARSIEPAIAAVSKALPLPDGDGDGILDNDDACPDRVGLKSADPIRRGCPLAAERIVVLPDADGHVGGVEVDDGRTKTLIDKAYGAVDVGTDGAAQLVAPMSSVTADRAIAVIAKTLPAADTDKDGIRDELDLCPDRAGAVSMDPLRNGCPVASEKFVVLPDADGHIGGIEIDDGKTKIVLDTAYASAEVAAGLRKTSASPAHAIARATEAIEKAMPLADRDDDNIVDSADACPDRAGPPSSQPIRNGCPQSVEQVIVLADENGHVGGVEVDDGTSKTVLDQEYASAEIGTDGRVRKLPAEPSEVSQRFAVAMAARPAGARIILYFTARSEPVRDLTGPLDNLVAELKAKATYTVEIIGHTDQTGSERANQRIGLERAQVIADRLVAAGIPRDRLTATSMGSKEPAVKRKSRRVVELRNRRVEIWVR